ncbi:hypothetical protein FZO89_15310 [Luteimonas viscosa]|uniref:Hydrazine synthase alpha subunit middle domain-containing protein n=1 Tax=Luteimonas viscosa TaxID=1132694 RepID=A0A5D4XGI0_9GAMM|nr:hypothetical protein [Luteimonas viscosa]TYT23609.1 hypothetical protein FZO89_15310 [Luteimonas viscosa]
MRHIFRASLLTMLAALGAVLAGCSTEQAAEASSEDKATTAETLAGMVAVQPGRQTAAARGTAKAISNPILFVTQVPTPGGDRFATRLSSFANHQPGMGSSLRGGDLMIRYADGTLRNLTREAGYGMDGLQGANAIAVREPTVHWNGTRAIFSMVVGAPLQRYAATSGKWQLYEVTGLARGETARITRVAGQPANYNNVSPLYASDGAILFTSDRPRKGEAHLYPNLDEYESTPTVTGIFRLDPATGSVTILNHVPSGAFSPTIDSYGRVIFTRWDHLQHDQQQDGSIYLGYTFDPFNYSSESANATSVGLVRDTFPERRQDTDTPYGRVGAHTYNLFAPWQMNQDGTDELTLNHIGRQELVGDYGYLPRAFMDDDALSDNVNQSNFANRKHIRMDGGIFHIRENPVARGTYYGIYAREFGEGTTNQIVRITGAPTLNAEQMLITDASPAAGSNGLPGGRFRNPLPLTSGDMVASYTADAEFGASSRLRLHQLNTNASGMFVAGTALTPGIRKTVSWWTDEATPREYSGELWELEPVEVVARTPPPATSHPAIPSPERAVLSDEGVNEAALRNWLQSNDLALIVTRNQTSRDRGDTQQPFNLQVPGGVRKTRGSGRVYDIAHYQIVQANLVRAYGNNIRGRRPVAQPMDVAQNPANAAGPDGSVRIAADGSTAAFVPARRALSWQTVDPSGEPVVRERVWVTLQPGEIRTCAGCHGENSRNQAGEATPTNQPQALRELMRHWKQTYGGEAGRRRNGSAPLLPPNG